MTRDRGQRGKCDCKNRRVEKSIRVIGRINRETMKHAMPGAVVNVEIALLAQRRGDAEAHDVDAHRDPREPARALSVDRFHRELQPAGGARDGTAITKSVLLPRSA